MRDNAGSLAGRNALLPTALARRLPVIAIILMQSLVRERPVCQHQSSIVGRLAPDHFVEEQVERRAKIANQIGAIDPGANALGVSMTDAVAMRVGN